MISLDWEGDPGYTGPAYGIDAAMQGYLGTNSNYADAIQAIDSQLDQEAETMLSNGTESRWMPVTCT